MSDVDEAQQFATYWYCDRTTDTRVEQHDPIALTPLGRWRRERVSLQWTAKRECLRLDGERAFAARLCRAYTVLRTPSG